MATNIDNNFKIGLVTDRIQVCDVETGICKK
jgi:hypothetical protein